MIDNFLLGLFGFLFLFCVALAFIAVGYIVFVIVKSLYEWWHE